MRRLKTRRIAARPNPRMLRASKLPLSSVCADTASASKPCTCAVVGEDVGSPGDRSMHAANTGRTGLGGGCARAAPDTHLLLQRIQKVLLQPQQQRVSATGPQHALQHVKGDRMVLRVRASASAHGRVGEKQAGRVWEAAAVRTEAGMGLALAVLPRTTAPLEPAPGSRHQACAPAACARCGPATPPAAPPSAALPTRHQTFPASPSLVWGRRASRWVAVAAVETVGGDSIIQAGERD
jgi:hypothetical protein